MELYTISKLLGHKDMSTRQRYSHLRDQALREASDLGGSIIAEAMKKKQAGKVVALADSTLSRLRSTTERALKALVDDLLIINKYIGGPAGSVPDQFSEWLHTCCHQEEMQITPSTALYKSFCAHRVQLGLPKMTQTAWGRLMKKNFMRRKVNGIVHYSGIEVRCE